MPTNPEIYCVQIPPLIRIELKDQYTSWFERCIFTHNTKNIPNTASLIILPASILLNNDKIISNLNIIAFGNDALLESSFLSGVDDYLKDPWSCSELIIRSSRYINGKTIWIEQNEIVCRQHEFYINKEAIELTPIQGAILSILFENPNVYFSCKELQDILPPGSISSENSLYVQIHNIRKILKTKIADIYGKSIILKNSNRRGYILFLPVDNLCKNVDKL